MADLLVLPRFFDFIRTMGAGSRMNESETKKDVFKHVPVEKPPFGMADVKKAIPPHCFNRSLSTSFAIYASSFLFFISQTITSPSSLHPSHT
ncbi:hypothetical protein Hdeb2414_s0025g00658261 [Helianthus debilis subsp. tardiflorus]